MIVHVKLFAMLTRYHPETPAGIPFQVELPENATLHNLLQILHIPEGETKITFVNNQIQNLDYPLKDGDVVGIFPPVAGGAEKQITINVWLYGELAKYAAEDHPLGYANIRVSLPINSTLQTLLETLHLPSQERGITFINGNLSAMPGVQPDLDQILQNEDRVAFFHLRSMWPFQYRFGITMTNEMTQSITKRDDQGLHHIYKLDWDDM
ncbi:MAG: MoaD/ThiS family protein [Anaerolineales bacterium]